MRTFKAFGQCAVGGNKILDVNGFGPMIVTARQWDDADFLLSICKQDSNGFFATSANPYVAGAAQETARAGDTGYNGTGAQLVFTYTVGGNGDLGNSFGDPVVPGTLTVTDAGSVAPDLQDIYADGILYTVDGLEAAGTIDYENGYLNLSYPTGHAPGTGATAINVAYKSGTWITGYGNHMYTVNTPLRDDLVRIVGLSKSSGLVAVRLGLEVAFGW